MVYIYVLLGIYIGVHICPRKEVYWCIYAPFAKSTYMSPMDLTWLVVAGKVCGSGGFTRALPDPNQLT